jgi:hypothetical protein
MFWKARPVGSKAGGKSKSLALGAGGYRREHAESVITGFS